MNPITWELFERQVAECRLCPLYGQIQHKVPGQGDRNAPLMLIGEGPGQVEDEEGLAFVGPAGQLLTRMLEAIGLPRERVYICNVVKCRPPQNRDPLPEEQDICIAWLRRQFAVMRPKIIVCLGRIAAARIIKPDIRIKREHGTVIRKGGVLMMPVLHPAALLRNPSDKPGAFQDFLDLQKLIQENCEHTYDGISWNE